MYKCAELLRGVKPSPLVYYVSWFKAYSFNTSMLKRFWCLMHNYAALYKYVTERFALKML